MTSGTKALQSRSPLVGLQRYVRSASTVLADVGSFGRFAWRLRRHLGGTLSLEEARSIVQQRLAERDVGFLRMVERTIYGYPRSPYLAMLRQAGCEVGDLRDLVRTRGLEGGLRALREAGVYVTYEEFKGRVPIVRNGREIRVTSRDFDNPLIHRDYQGDSGGSTGPATPVPVDLDLLAAEAAPLMVAYDAHGVLGVPMVLWRGLLPDTTGINNILKAARFRSFPLRWFSPVAGPTATSPPWRRYATQSFVMMARMVGAPIPWPEPLGLERAAVVARTAKEAVKRWGACLIRTPISLAVRVSIAAREEGLDLTGVTFHGGGEPATPAKVREITRAGARHISNYAFAEAGTVGIACAQPADGNDIHLHRDAFAVIQHPRRVAGSDGSVEALHFTTLLPSASKVMLNAESDDCGVVEDRRCGCAQEHVGYTQHLRHIRSFGKLTSEGEAILGADLIRILEEVLPAQFGGTPQDYQLYENEGPDGLNRVDLLVNPTVSIGDERAVVDAVLNALPDRGARSIWRQATTLRVKRMPPIWTDRGKLPPLYRAGPRRHGSGPAPGEAERS